MDLFVNALFVLCILFPVLHLINCLPSFRRSGEAVTLNHKPEKEHGISILIPCFNEQAFIDTSVQSMNSLPYSSYEVIYINDGSSDDTMERLIDFLKLEPVSITRANNLTHKKVTGCYQSSIYPNFYVIDKVNGGKADALNTGIEYASKELIITLDADTLLSEEALPVVNAKFQQPEVVAAGGMVHVLQTRSQKARTPLSIKAANLLIRAQMLDFLKGFYISKISLSRLQSLSIISGAFGIFRKDMLISVGGYRSTIGEDIDITLRIHQAISNRKDQKIVFIPESVCFTELPENWRDFFKQRIRWQKAFIDCLIHFRSFFAKTILTKPLSLFFIIESFLVGTVSTYLVTGLILTDLIFFENGDLYHYLTFYLFYICFAIIYNLSAIFMSRSYGYHLNKQELTELIGTILFDILIFRFALMYPVMHGSISYFFNKDWNKVARTGRKYHAPARGM
ncbi:glycosyltransferase family 2 protein [Jeotgalibacillus aurantiacus]|uniref:glycosyltransferase family 2 protein n=1 Tax=Jeotgalibacillus aurantiacus TaxID=2763266 RepID=UPI001D09C6DF|nr:glycosyltransferase family 2 protein [Jeotgalibacillus aurantiacus]